MSAEAIRQTLARYCQTCDDGRFDEFEQLFAPSGSLQVPGMEPVAGRAAIRTFMEAAQPPERRGKHLCGEPLVVVAPSGASARASTDFIFVGRDAGAAWSIVAVGRYDDELALDPDDPDGTWRFTTRRITML